MSGPNVRRPQAPVPEMELLVIDGDNLLHRVRGMRDEAGLHWLLPRIKAWRPAGVEVLLMLDGSPGPGVGRRRQAVAGITMQHSGRLDGDTAIVELVRARGYGERTRTVVVTDDRQLTERARYAGVLVRRLDWLIELLARPNPDAAAALAAPGRGAGVKAAPARPAATGARRTLSRPPVGIGSGKPPRADATTPIERDPESPREPWKPGRGATVKHGNSRRTPKGPPA
ncbi:MAG: hypothetical protein LH650_07925 [Chloroflexi bacterium]|nr:hypothetical protein [Chloroflexota bacterium]